MLFRSGGGLYYSGGTTSALTISGANAAIAGHLYRVIGTYKGGWVISNAVSLSIITPALPGPSGVVLDSSGDAVVADSLNNTIQRVTSFDVTGLDFTSCNGGVQPPVKCVQSWLVEQSFGFVDGGEWTVRLLFDDGTVRESPGLV